MSSGKDDEVTQVAPPHLVPSTRPTGVEDERTEDLPALPVPERPLPAEPTSDVHELRDLTGPTQVKPLASPERKPSGVPEAVNELTRELPAPPKPGRIDALPDLPDPRELRNDLSEPTSVAFEPPGAGEPHHVTDESTEPTDVV
ncbi:MAG TPA: hypothetical protein VNM90_27720, partial [Haliangium sp.]|nr:hypothetical protein [Haliangium sp.]